MISRFFLLYSLAFLLVFRIEAGEPLKHNSDIKELRSVCISRSEWKLYQLINQYRKRAHLPNIPLSYSLTYVAQSHARDLAAHYENDAVCNLHSWSNSGPWTSCCYTSDHKESECMWNKPEELTGFKGFGYEIAYWNNYDYIDPDDIADDALKAWKKSKGHNFVIINRGMWKELDWKAIGVGIWKGYVLVWFSDMEDPMPSPRVCGVSR
jgi:hypothetical protein